MRILSSYLEQYKRRLQSNAGRPSDEINAALPITLREAQLNRARDSQRRMFFESPSLTYVKYNDTVNQPVIQSDKYKDIELQTFLFEPDFPIRIGSLIYEGEYTYLTTQKNGEKIYPELLAKLCNDFFEVPMGFTEHVTEDRFGDPIITKIPELVEVPAVISDKDYSTASNSIIPLPAGRINIDLPFREAYLDYFKVNFTFDHSAGSYQVTDIREVRITPDEKYIKVSAQRIQSNSEVEHDE